MAVDLNKAAEKLRRQHNVGVTRDGRIVERDPRNDGSSQSDANRGTTLEPKRFSSN